MLYQIKHKIIIFKKINKITIITIEVIKSCKMIKFFKLNKKPKISLKNMLKKTKNEPNYSS
jgi:hypothetical protein